MCSRSAMGDARVLDFLTNLCGLPLMSAVPLVPGFVAAGVTTRAQLFALNDADLRGKCGLSHAAQRKKVLAAIKKGEAECSSPRKRARAGGGGTNAVVDVQSGASTASIPTPQELDPSEIDIDSKISVNRSPVMILWSAVVAREVLGYNWEEALSLAHAVSALNAQSKASRIWGNEKPNESAVSVDGPAVEGVVLLGRNVPACLQTQADGVRGCVSGSAIDPRAPSNRLKQAFPGPALSHVYSSMVHLARHVADAIRVNSRHAYTLYETFRPEIPDGPGGWGMCGLLSLSKILEPLGETWREDISAQRKESERTAGVGNRRKGVHDGQMQIKVEDDGNGVAAGTCVMMESFTGKHTDSQVKEENAEQAHTAQEEEEGQDGDACFTRGKQDRIGLVSQGRSVGEDATNCILAVIQSAGPEGVIEQVLQKQIGHVDAKDVRALVEEMQLDGLLYSKDGRLFLL